MDIPDVFYTKGKEKNPRISTLYNACYRFTDEILYSHIISVKKKSEIHTSIIDYANQLSVAISEDEKDYFLMHVIKSPKLSMKTVPVIANIMKEFLSRYEKYNGMDVEDVLVSDINHDVLEEITPALFGFNYLEECSTNMILQKSYKGIVWGDCARILFIMPVQTSGARFWCTLILHTSSRRNLLSQHVLDRLGHPNAVKGIDYVVKIGGVITRAKSSEYDERTKGINLLGYDFGRDGQCIVNLMFLLDECEPTIDISILASE